jgi:hypothetical protein
LSFPPEASQAIGIRSERFRQDFQRDVTIQPAVTGAIDLTHPAGTDRGQNLVRADAGTWFEWHERAWRTGL